MDKKLEFILDLLRDMAIRHEGIYTEEDRYGSPDAATYHKGIASGLRRSIALIEENYNVSDELLHPDQEVSGDV